MRHAILVRSYRCDDLQVIEARASGSAVSGIERGLRRTTFIVASALLSRYGNVGSRNYKFFRAKIRMLLTAGRGPWRSLQN